MIGLIQRVLIDRIEADHGEDAMASIAKQAGIDSPGRRIDTDYADIECLSLFEATQRYLSIDHEALMARYADWFIVWAKRHYPMFFTMADSAQSFLARQPCIHASLGASLHEPVARDRVSDKFHILQRGERSLTVDYRSANGLCALYRAIVARVLEEYQQSGTLSETLCRHRGDDRCRFVLHFDEAPE
ncbi:heme NO-binding domain-containing protein [Salinicola aestuarinus]|uniref:heme NO-binding domain-containing protein n=1 Tax=Salinicola aestuarinus TaxID=1949082 RepID=UPI000DA1E6CE|nr:heme NO-binding domain-containing protein [Salinicola aestuarinus]